MFEIYRSEKNEEYYFRLKAANGEIILASQAYKEKANCLKGVESVKANAAGEQHYERKTAADGRHFFNLKAANGQVIGTSQMYASASALENGISSVTANAPGAGINDLTA